MGEKRTSLYLTLISAGGAVLIGIEQLGLDARSLLWTAALFLLMLLVVGLVTFQRLIERRTRATEYLRAINRVHRYFVDLDPSLKPYFYWPACDDVPSFGGNGGAFMGLRDVIAVLNSLFVGCLVVVIVIILWPGLGYTAAISLAVVAIAIAWFAHARYERRNCCQAATKAGKYVRFPKDEGD
ncbi:MAG: hypothetical protein L6435_07605 [Anaerolineae bacterium]|nr:hypothetical protein [Anaerolineae bacterium]